MVQFYLLSVVANLIAGSMLSVDLLEAKVGAFKGMGQFVRERPKMGLVAGIVAFAVGFFMLSRPCAETFRSSEISFPRSQGS